MFGLVINGLPDDIEQLYKSVPQLFKQKVTWIYIDTCILTNPTVIIDIFDRQAMIKTFGLEKFDYVVDVCSHSTNLKYSLYSNVNCMLKPGGYFFDIDGIHDILYQGGLDIKIDIKGNCQNVLLKHSDLIKKSRFSWWIHKYHPLMKGLIIVKKTDTIKKS